MKLTGGSIDIANLEQPAEFNRVLSAFLAKAAGRALRSSGR
jgi:hypothetical protein